MSNFFSTYPPKFIKTKNNTLNILQLTDLHLKNSSNYVSKYNSIENFELILNQALSDSTECDLILLTGDLIHEMDYNLYDDIFKIINTTNIPFACIAGNHDVTDEVGHNLPFDKRKLVGYESDNRLLSCHNIESEYWQILLLDSSHSGKISGLLNENDLNWLHNQLNNNHKPAIICLHHHPIPIDSYWMDQHILVNANQLWDTILPFSHTRAIIHGHIHQEYYNQVEHIAVLGAPSTCYQFKPKQFNFTLDNINKSGYRWLYLYNQGSLATEIKRIS